MKTLIIIALLFIGVGLFSCHKVDDFKFEDNGYVAYKWIKHDSVNYYVKSSRRTVPIDCDTVLVRQIWINYYTDHYHCNVLQSNDKWITWDEHNFEGEKE